METQIATRANGTTAAHTPASATPASTPAKDRPAAIIDSEMVTHALERLHKVVARVTAYTTSDEEARAGLAMIKEQIGSAIAMLASVPGALVDVSSAVERGSRKRAGGIEVGASVRIKDAHRKTFAGAVASPDMLDDLTVRSVNDTHLTVETEDGTRLAPRLSQVESTEDPLDEGQGVKIKPRYLSTYEACVDDPKCLDDLRVVKCNGQNVIVRAPDTGARFPVRLSHLLATSDA